MLNHGALRLAGLHILSASLNSCSLGISSFFQLHNCLNPLLFSTSLDAFSSSCSKHSQNFEVTEIFQLCFKYFRSPQKIFEGSTQFLGLYLSLKMQVFLLKLLHHNFLVKNLVYFYFYALAFLFHISFPGHMCSRNPTKNSKIGVHFLFFEAKAYFNPEVLKFISILLHKAINSMSFSQLIFFSFSFYETKDL